MNLMGGRAAGCWGRTDGGRRMGIAGEGRGSMGRFVHELFGVVEELGE